MKALISHAPGLSLKKSSDLTMNNSSLKCPTSAQYNTELMDRKQRAVQRPLLTCLLALQTKYCIRLDGIEQTGTLCVM